MRVLKYTLFVILIQRGSESVKFVSDVEIPDFKTLSYKYGYPAREHYVVTEDGYILTVFRIPGIRRPPVLLMHGIGDTSDTWILRGNNSMAITLAAAGYDVWLGNIRGNKYSRRHLYLNPDSAAYWNITFHEYGYYDLASTIDTVLMITGEHKLNAFGHSQGNTIFYVLCSTRPDYNRKINWLTALAPICYLHHVPPPLSIYIKLSPLIDKLLRSFNLNELFRDDSIETETLRDLCPKPVIGYFICADILTFPLTGFDKLEMEADFVRVAVKHFPNGVSRKNLAHFGQVGIRKKFARFDYGEAGNLAEYNSLTPPMYNLSKVTTRVILLAARNDNLSPLKDVAILRSALPNVVEYSVNRRWKMNHIDYIWGKHMRKYLYPYIFKVLRKFN